MKWKVGKSKHQKDKRRKRKAKLRSMDRITRTLAKLNKMLRRDTG